MSWTRDRVNINTVLTNLERELQKLDQLTSENIEGLYDTEILETKMYHIELIVKAVADFSTYWNNYCKTFKEAVDNDKDDKNQLLEEIADLKGQLKEKESEIAKLMDIISGHPSEEVITRCIELLDQVETNVNVLSLQRKLKDKKLDRTGENAPGWKPVSSEDLAEEYKASGNKITKQMQEKYGLTQAAIRTRLIKLGVYENKWSNK